MTITDDYKVFAGRYHPSSGAFTRPPLEVSDCPTNAQEILHGLGVPKFTNKSSGKKPHGKPTIAGSEGVWQQGCFKATKVGDRVSTYGGSSSVKEAHKAGKTVGEYCPTAVKVDEGRGRSANMWQCRCC